MRGKRRGVAASFMPIEVRVVHFCFEAVEEEQRFSGEWGLFNGCSEFFEFRIGEGTESIRLESFREVFLVSCDFVEFFLISKFFVLEFIEDPGD